MSQPASPESVPAKTPAESRGELAELMMPQHANILGKVFGGTLLAMVDKAAAVAAIRHASRTCVTAQIDRVTFHSPIEIGELVRCLSMVNWVGRTSLEARVEVVTENPLRSEPKTTNIGYVVYVAIDANGVPTEVPELIYETPEQLQRAEQAKQRQAYRKQQRDLEKA